MNELVKRGFELLERYWHKKATAVIAPIIVSCVLLLCVFYFSQPKTVSTAGWVFSLTIGAILGIVWGLTNRLPRVKKGNAGIVIGILCDDPAEDKQVKIDFIANLKQLVQQGGSLFQLVELPSWALGELENPTVMSQLLQKVRGHFLLYGRVRMRNKDGKPAHLISFEGMVRHRPVPNEISKMLNVDFTKVLPRRVVIEKENDAFTFEATSEWTDVSARYVVGMAALISGDVAYAENLFLYVGQKLKQNKNSNTGIKEIERLLPQRLHYLYEVWLKGLYEAYFSTRETRYLVKLDEISSKLLQYDPKNYGGMMNKAICEFVLRRNVSGAHKIITKCRNDSDYAWWYSRAFLHAYQGKMDEAISDYNQAFSGPIIDKSVPVQCEEFIQKILSEEPDRYQLYFCLGLINYHAKPDYVAAERDLIQFLTKRKGEEFSRQAVIAQKMIEDCKTKNLIMRHG